MKKETLSIRFLYGTMAGRVILKPLVHPFVSRQVGKFLDSRLSGWLVPLFIKKHQIDMEECAKTQYCSFNAFFSRKRRFERIDAAPGHLISPCDGYLSVYPIDEGMRYQIKNVEYKLEELLKSKELAAGFRGGTCLIFRLTPQNYHRYCYACDGIRSRSHVIRGILHCVRPMAYTSVPVFVENSREYTVLRTEHFGTVVQMEIGALLVGRIHNYAGKSVVRQGEEKGYFEFGGSTIVVLVGKDRLKLTEEVEKNTKMGREMQVRLGERIGVKMEVKEKEGFLF